MKPTIIDSVGNKFWYKDGCQKYIFHREDGPAIEYNSGTKWWYKEGLCHRLDGPAIEYANGSKYWCYEGRVTKQVSSQEEFEQWLKYKVFL